MTKNLTIGNVLPSQMNSDYSEAVLNTTLTEAIGIALHDKPSTSGLTSSDISSVKQIYSMYLNKGGQSGSDSAYWNKSKADNDAYWNKGG